MGTFSDLDVMSAITAPPVGKGDVPSLQPLIDVLRGPKEIGLSLRLLMADLMDDGTDTAYRLRYGRRDKRRLLTQDSVERNVRAYRVIEDLSDRRVDQALCSEIVDLLPKEWTITKSGASYQLKKYGCIEVEYREGATFSRPQATYIAAQHINKSYQMVRKMIAELDAVLQAG